ncbi:MAG: helix-turn-helix transcriptional regulator [Bacteroidota bacterium]
MHVTNISRYERGENKPTSQVLTKLAKHWVFQQIF